MLPNVTGPLPFDQLKRGWRCTYTRCDDITFRNANWSKLEPAILPYSRFFLPLTAGTRFKVILVVANIVLSCYSLLALLFSLLTDFHTLKNARILLVANTPSSPSARLPPPLLCSLHHLQRPHPQPRGQGHPAGCQELGAAGRLTIQSVLGCCGYFSPFVEATVSATCYSRSILPGCEQQSLEFPEKALTRWSIVSFGMVPVHIAIMAAGLLCSNHVTYRFGKGMTLKAYRLGREAMAVGWRSLWSNWHCFKRSVDGVGVGAGGVPGRIRARAQWSTRCQLVDQYGAAAAAHMIANNSGNTGPRAQTHTRGTGSGSGSGGYAQMPPPNPFSPNPTPAASASDLSLAGPRPHEDGDEEGDGYSYGYGGVEEGDERGAGGQHAKYESLDIGAARF
ncbi:hypothetical protein B0H16DRAFT_1696432 [Mycena metata]|uniref:Uncharacterized protein n=1 Tax=Mycena metata TaxID=1033252 RepID=A0AAD7I0J3_9AGAR|nr:hypothetical protein B0H16DRAFT_1696432 [Mycena metata]